MSVSLVTKFAPYTDEKFSLESKKAILTNQDFDWTGAHTVKIFKVSTAALGDYDRNGSGSNISRYGEIKNLDAITEEFTLSQDKAFTFAIDRLDEDETAQQLSAASALEREQREIVIPTVDAYTIAKMAFGAGTKADAVTLTADNIFDMILAGTSVMDDELVPDEKRCLVVTPSVYQLMKKSSDIVMNCDVGEDMRVRGVIGNLDGLTVIRMPESRLPEKFGFMICHPSATVAPTKLEEYRVHTDAPFVSGSLVEGRICYDAFVLDNKKMGIYYQAVV